MDPDLLSPKHLPDEHVDQTLKGFLAQAWGNFQIARYNAILSPGNQELAEVRQEKREIYEACLEQYEEDTGTLKALRANRKASEKLARGKENGREKPAGKVREVALAGETKL